MRVVVVGPCASGKTTLVNNLRQAGIEAHNVAQEHSGVKRLWRKKQPDVLVLLDVSMPTVRKRREVPWGEERLTIQRDRLSDAKANAHLYIQTDNLTKQQVLNSVLDYIGGTGYGSAHVDGP
jgi:CheY-like chemotaxis protein